MNCSSARLDYYLCEDTVVEGFNVHLGFIGSDPQQDIHSGESVTFQLPPGDCTFGCGRA